MLGQVLRISFVLFCAIVFAAYISVQVRHYFLPAFAADEIAFFIWSAFPDFAVGDGSITAFLSRPNLAGYGAMYWNGYINLKSLFGSDAMWGMRAAALCAWLSLPMSSLWIGSRIRFGWGWMLVLLWCTLPMAWWTGKVTGPELFSVAAAVQGVLLLSKGLRTEEETPRLDLRWWIAGWFLIGAGIAIKLTTLPVALFAFLSLLPWRELRLQFAWHLLRRYVVAGVAAAAGFIVINPLLIVSPTRFFQQLGSLPKGEVWSWSVARLTLSNEMWNWDGVFCGGLAEWSLVLPAAVLLLIAIGLVRWWNLVCLIVSVAFCWLLMIAAGSTLGWYWFGAIALVLPALLVSVPAERISGSLTGKAAWVTFTAACLVNAWYQWPRVADQTAMKIRQVSAIQALPELQTEVSRVLTEHGPYDRIVDFSEITLKDALCFSSEAAKEVVQASPPCIPNLTPQWKEKLDRYSGSSYDRCMLGILSDSFTAILQMGEKGTDGKRVLLIVSKRLASKHAFGGLDNFIREWIVAKSPKGTGYKCLADLEHTWIYEVVPMEDVESASNGEVSTAMPDQ